MNSPKPNNTNDEHSRQDKYGRQVSTRVQLKQRARRNPSAGVWFGLGMMGLIGWSVVVPTLLGAALGLWLDTHYRDTHSWTLALLMAGLSLGCFNAWHWVTKQDEAMHQDLEQNTESDLNNTSKKLEENPHDRHRD